MGLKRINPTDVQSAGRRFESVHQLKKSPKIKHFGLFYFKPSSHFNIFISILIKFRIKKMYLIKNIGVRGTHSRKTHTVKK